MKSKCAWCGKNLADVPAENMPSDAITHGICTDCGNQLMSQAGTPLFSFLEKLNIPVLVVNGRAETLWVSANVCEAIGKSSDQATSGFAGDVFDCVHATKPEGCGKTIHCSGCVIRRCITQSADTGDICVRVPALKPAYADDETPCELYVTTLKSNDVVLLRIDVAPAEVG